MIADPKPDQVFFMLNCQGAITKADSHGPLTADLFEMQRGMARIIFEQLEIFIGQSPNVRRQAPVEGTRMLKLQGASQIGAATVFELFDGLGTQSVELAGGGVGFKLS